MCSLALVRARWGYCSTAAHITLEVACAAQRDQPALAEKIGAQRSRVTDLSVENGPAGSRRLRAGPRSGHQQHITRHLRELITLADRPQRQEGRLRT